MVAKTGSIARASEQLHLTPQSISGQLSEFEENLGVALFRRSGRNLVLTEAGQRILSYADEIFSIGNELLDALRDQSVKKSLPFRVGIADSVSKAIAYRLVEPALSINESVKLICREGRLSSLLADLSVHRLDLIIADSPMPTNLNVRGYSHLLGESSLTIFGVRKFSLKLAKNFPLGLNNAPFLLPGEDVAARPAHLGAQLDQRLDEHRGLDGHVQAADDAGALQRVLALVLGAKRHQTRHLHLGQLDLLATKAHGLGRQVLHLEGQEVGGVEDGVREERVVLGELGSF